MADQPGSLEPLPSSPRPSRGLWHWSAILAVFGLTVVILRFEGQPWWCRCGRLSPWSGEIHSGHNSQHLLDPYSFTHVLHGLLFYAIFRPLAGKLGTGTRMVVALALESLWEVIENSDVVIERYRQATIALGYSGDSVVNSLGDIASCAVGLALAFRLPIRWSVVLFIAVEAVLLAVYRDSLVLSVVMLVCPIDAVKSWQMGR